MDNASDDGTAELLASHPAAPEVLRLTKNLGYAGGLEAALSRVHTPFMAWLNDDAAPEPGWLAAMEDALDAESRAAAASATLVSTEGCVRSMGVRLTSDGHGADLETASGEVFGFCGGAALVRTEVLHAIGGVPAEYFCYYEDTDTAWRLRLAGWQVITVPAARVPHRHGASTRPGSHAFHRWNERNRLLTLLRCAPGSVAARELARFAGITAALPVRRLPIFQRHGVKVPYTSNFSVALRLRVLAAVVSLLPGTLKARKVIGEHCTVDRRTVWRTWAGR